MRCSLSRALVIFMEKDFRIVCFCVWAYNCICPAPARLYHIDFCFLLGCGHSQNGFFTIVDGKYSLFCCCLTKDFFAGCQTTVSLMKKNQPRATCHIGVRSRHSPCLHNYFLYRSICPHQTASWSLLHRFRCRQTLDFGALWLFHTFCSNVVWV